MRLKTVRTRTAIGGAVLLGLTALLSPVSQATAIERTELGAPNGIAATLTGENLVISWSPDRLWPMSVLVDERTGATLWQGESSVGSASTPVMGSTSVLLYAADPSGRVLVGKVMAMVPEAGSALPAITTVLTNEGMHLDWNATSAVDEWSVQDRSGAVLSTVSIVSEVNLPYTLSSVPDQVVLTGDGLVDGVSTRLISGFAINGNAAQTQSFSSGDGDQIGAGSTGGITASYLKYETYIPTKYIDAPDTGWGTDCEAGDNTKNYVYSGDDRGLEFNTLKYRSLAMPTFRWLTKETNGNRWVSPTHRYIKYDDGTYTHDSQRVASVDGMAVSATKNDGFMGSGTISHSIGNPYCAAWNSIDYTETHDLWVTGAYYIRGKHDQMPRHLVYLNYDRTDTGAPLDLVFHHELKDPMCLNSVYETLKCPKWEYQYTK